MLRLKSRSSALLLVALIGCALPHCHRSPLPATAGRSDAAYPLQSPAPPSSPPAPTLHSGDPQPLATQPAELEAVQPPLAPPPADGPTVTLEPPYRFGESSSASDRVVANRGGLGTLVGDPPPPPAHPHPRIVIEVPGTRGPHPRKKVEAKLRSTFWHQTVECYREGAYLDQTAKGEVELVVSIMANGEVKGARVQANSFKDKSVSQCLAQKVRKLTLTRSRRGSDATVLIKIWPGDDPVPPPERLAIAGDGSLPPEVVTQTVDASLDAFRACYEPALSYAPQLWGRMAVRVHIDESGQVDEAFEIESAFPDEHVRRCVLKAAHTLTFPTPDAGDLRLVLPFRFSPSATPVVVETDVSPPASP